MRLTTDRDADAPAHASIHNTPADGLALMEMPCSCCIGHGSSPLRHAAAMVAEMGVFVFFSSTSLWDSYVEKKSARGGEKFFHQLHE